MEDSKVVGSFCRTKQGQNITKLHWWCERRTSYTVYQERHSFSCPLLSLWWLFLLWIDRHHFVALWRREDLTTQQPASQSLRNQPLMDVCKTLNRLKWFVGCICFWHYLFWSVNLHLTGSHSTTQTCYSHTPQATLRALLVQKWGPTLHLPTRLACWESLTELTDLKLRNPCYSSF